MIIPLKEIPDLNVTLGNRVVAAKFNDRGIDGIPELIIELKIWVYNNDGTLTLKPWLKNPYDVPLVANNTTPVDINGNYVLVNGAFATYDPETGTWNSPDVYKGEYDYIVEAIANGADIITMMHNAILRAYQYGRLD